MCISHLPIHPPAWAALPTDEKLYEPADPDAPLPERLDMDSNSTCPCTGNRTTFNPSVPTEDRVCTIYGWKGAHSALVQLQKCPTCPPRRNRKIGPDPRHLGIFNYNNTTLVTHELLDEYTSQYTTSETPFTSFCTTTARRYSLRNSKFMDETLFRSVWMAYADLQILEGDMMCDECGIAPETVIVDGVTLSFGRKHLLQELKPPTQLSDASPARNRCSYQPRQQFLVDAKARRDVRDVVQGTRMTLLLKGDVEEGGEAEARRRHKAAEAALEHLAVIAKAEAYLGAQDADLAALFTKHYGARAYMDGKTAPRECRELFLQVGGMIQSGDNLAKRWSL